MSKKCVVCHNDIPKTIIINSKTISLGNKRSKCLICSPYVPMSQKLSTKVCKKCGKQFSNRVNNGVKSFYSNKRMYCIDCSPIKDIKVYPHQYYCPQCKQILTKNDFHWHTKLIDVRHNAECKQCCAQNQKQKLLILKQKLVDYVGGECCNCGYKKCLAALEFHHTDPSQKDPDFPKLLKSGNDIKIKTELNKCILLCANCHREKHN